jgi:glycosyltransferase involved in cell wall biosynthesis
MEALAGGWPVVALSAPATREVIRDGVEGLLVSPAKGALAATLLKLRAAPELRDELSDGALRRADDFAAANMITRLETIYEEVAANYNPPKSLTETLLPDSFVRRRYRRN